jgi:hypothetical protein
MVFKENKTSEITGANYDKVVGEGLLNEGLSIEDILYEEQIDNGKVIVITANNALGIVYISKDKDVWKWNRTSPFYDWKSQSDPLPHYMSGLADIELSNGKKYFLAMGKIFNPEIVKLTLADDEINATIVERNGNVFWFKLLDNKDSFEDIKTYNKDDKEIKD